MTAQEGLFLTSAVPDPDSAGRVPGVDGLAINPAKTSGLSSSFAGSFDPFTAPPTAFHAFVIPAAIKPLVSEWLRKTHGRTRSTLFPDLAGLADHYRERTPRSVEDDEDHTAPLK